MTSRDPVPSGRTLSRATAIVRLALLALVLVTVALVAVRVGPDVASIRAFVAGTGWVGPVAYVAAYALLTVALVPGTLLTVSGGLLFGIVGGSLLTVVGAAGGAVAAFLVSRLAGRAAVDRLVTGRVARVDDWLAARGTTAVLTLRLVPLVPFNVANYAAGVTAVRLRDYVVGTTFGIVPGVIAYTVLGARAQDPTGPAFIIASVALALLAVGGFLVARRTRPGSPGTTAATRDTAHH